MEGLSINCKYSENINKERIVESLNQCSFLKERTLFFEQLMKIELEKNANRKSKEIKITLKDGTIKKGLSYKTTPIIIAQSIGKSFSEAQIICKVNGTLWDLKRVLEDDSAIEFFTFEDDVGKQVFWHSSAHIMGEATEKLYSCLLCHGPPTDDGFFYDMGFINEIKTISQEDYEEIEAEMTNSIKEKQNFDRLVVSKENLLKMFSYNKYKVHFIQTKIPDGGSTTVYKCGTLIDLCLGPHIIDSGVIKAFKLMKNSSSYFMGDCNQDLLQRLYGTSFPDKKLLKSHLAFLKEATERDHRKISKEQELFFFNDLSPGSAFWLPHGSRIYNTLCEFMRTEYRKRGYLEVISPNMYNSKLWLKSGHWENYKENMFVFDVEKENFALKPMNCPGHCLMYKQRERSYRELPWRVADFGVLHRNEFSGALSGLTRVRRFQQDDAHIFCTIEQIESEINGCFDFMSHIYDIFGFEYKMTLSTRPDNYVGDIKVWDEAEKVLEKSLNNFLGKGNWVLNPGDGAFYGPKIDILIGDAMKRMFQCATIQLDFQLPIRFELEYKHESTSKNNEYHRPVMIHRALLGSVERMTAILIEHYNGKWPFWLSPRQILIVPVSLKYDDYAKSLNNILNTQHFFYSDVDLSGNTLSKKVRSGQLLKYNFIFIVGEEEMNSKSVNVRNRDCIEQQKKNQMIKFDLVVTMLEKLRAEKGKDNILFLS